MHFRSTTDTMPGRCPFSSGGDGSGFFTTGGGLLAVVLLAIASPNSVVKPLKAPFKREKDLNSLFILKDYILLVSSSNELDFANTQRRVLAFVKM